MKRRKFLNGLVAGAGGIAMAGALSGLAHGANRAWRPAARRKAVAEPRHTARNAIFVLLDGGPSHVDTFDLKEGRETPAFLGAMDMGGWLWPAGIMPKLAARTDRFSLARSLTAVEAVHERAVYHLTTAHRHDPSSAADTPHFASALSYLLADQRRPTDSLPTVALFGPTMAANGLFPVEHRGLTLGEDGGIPNLRHDFPEAETRFDLLNGLLAEMGETGDRRGERRRILRQAQRLMDDRELHALLGLDAEPDPAPEGDNGPGAAFLRQCEAAARLIEADKGARVVQMFLGGWDHHINIYSQDAFGLPGLAAALDEGLAFLIDRLAGKPGVNGGTLLDETLIVAAGEFGRTTGALNQSQGRDHFPYVLSALFAGGGVQGGRVIGRTDATGAAILDPGWSRNRYMGIGDLIATLYSALGLDWTQELTDTPSGRPFQLIPANQTGPVYDIAPLFA